MEEEEKEEEQEEEEEAPQACSPSIVFSLAMLTPSGCDTRAFTTISVQRRIVCH